MIADFVYAPDQYVLVTLHGLKYRGRVLASIWETHTFLYDVRYADDNGELRSGKFSADELVPMEQP